jgi:sulfur-oxidizing protein SoxZ
MSKEISANQGSTIPMRLSIKGEVKPGKTVQAALSIGHPMESGFRTLESGQRVPKNVIERISVRLGQEPLFELDTGIGISAHPYLSFPVPLPTVPAADQSDPAWTLHITWVDDLGQSAALIRHLADAQA